MSECQYKKDEAKIRRRKKKKRLRVRLLHLMAWAEGTTLLNKYVIDRWER